MTVTETAPSRCGADSTSIHSIELGAGWWSRVSADTPEIQIADAHATHLGRYRMLARLSRARREIRRVRPRGAPTAAAGGCYIVRRFTTGRLTDETHWLPNKEMTKLSEVSDETSTNLFPHFQCQTLQCDTSTLKPRPGGSGPVA